MERYYVSLPNHAFLPGHALALVDTKDLSQEIGGLYLVRVQNSCSQSATLALYRGVDGQSMKDGVYGVFSLERWGNAARGWWAFPDTWAKPLVGKVKHLVLDY